MRGLIVLRMTRARNLAPGLGNPPLLQLLLDAVTCAFVCLVQGVATTFGMRFNRRTHDWHMGSSQEALPQTKPDIHTEEELTPTVSFSGLSRESLLDHPKGLTNNPLETINQDSRDKPENDPVDVPAGVPAGVPADVPADVRPGVVLTHIPSTVIPAEARQRGLSRRSVAKAEELEPRSRTRRHLRRQPLASGSRLRGSGMTMCAQIRPI